jgi:hypothetical protein
VFRRHELRWLAGLLAHNHNLVPVHQHYSVVLVEALDVLFYEFGPGHDQLATGRKRHVLTIIDRFSGYSPAIESRFMSWRYSGRWCPDGVGRTRAAVHKYFDRVNADRALRTHPRLTHGW